MSFNRYNPYADSLYVKPRTQKEWQFIASYDDLSDDEAEDKEVEYKVLAQEKVTGFYKKLDADYKKLNIPPKKQPIHERNDELLSFVSHYLGVELFYSPLVNQFHRTNKQKWLSNISSISTLCYLIYDAVMEQCCSSLMAIKELIKWSNGKLEIVGGSQNYLSNWGNLRSKFLDKFNAQVSVLIWGHREVLIDWFRSRYQGGNQPRVDEFLEKIRRLFESIFNEYFYIIVISDREKFDATNALIDFVEKEVTDITEECKLSELKWNKKGEALRLLNKKGTALAKIMAAHLSRHDKGRLTITNRMNDIRKSETFRSEIFEKKLQVYQDRIKEKKPLSENRLAALRSYFSISQIELVDKMLNFSMVECYQALINKMRKLPRPILWKSATLGSGSYLDFLVGLRLSNCSGNRHIKNLREMTYQYDSVSRVWVFEKVASIGIPVLETQHILSGSLGRQDEVLVMGSYKDVYAAVKMLRDNFDILDEQIAKWIRDIVCGREVILDKNIPIFNHDEILHQLCAISYLLLGCEAVRNPAMFILNQMLLDLIIQKNETHWTWEEALTGAAKEEAAQEKVKAKAKEKEKAKTLQEIKAKTEELDKAKAAAKEKHPKKMPMSPKGAVSAARKLERDYATFLPYSYKYPGNPEDKCVYDLASLEGRVVRHWIKYNAKVPGKSSDLSREGFAIWLMNTIRQSYVVWFGIPAETIFRLPPLLGLPELPKLPESPKPPQPKTSLPRNRSLPNLFSPAPGGSKKAKPKPEPDSPPAAYSPNKKRGGF